MTQPLFSALPTPLASASSFKPKRKHAGDDEDAQQHSLDQLPRPPIKRRATVNDQAFTLPELVADHSNSASDDDIAMDQDGDQSMDAPDSPLEERDGCGIGRSYAYGEGGTGGFGFGPGAEEDDMMVEVPPPKEYPTVYPSLTPHPNPNHFSNHMPYTNTQPQTELGAALPVNFRPKSPLSVQSFSTSLAAPRSAGLLQPALNGPLGPDATDIERIRAAHGTQCKSIPKLTVSPYPDPMTGNQTMYSLCPDCGTIEKIST